MKSHYRVVVIGGGIVGTSVLYHLAKFGWTDVALIERAELTCEQLLALLQKWIIRADVPQWWDRS